jgi:tetratricopeptide (TPR) repeat protein
MGCKMSKTFIADSLRATLLTTTLLLPAFAWSQDNAAVSDADASSTQVAEPADVDGSDANQAQDYQRMIAQIESREGAYADELAESLLSLALTLQSQGQHEEAIKLFKRGVHLTRINEGLYCPEQIPLLQGEIASHKASRHYLQADERQNYLYRVQIKSMAGTEAMADAFMDQARWQYDAYQLDLAEEDYGRLINMLELYRMAFKDVVTREGEKSPDLLPPLRGMLQAQYLISQYDIEPTTPIFGEDGHIDEELLRFKTYHAKSYQQGNAIIEAIASIEQDGGAVDSVTLANTWVMLGDWRLWNGRTSAAWEAYREATTELARSDAAQEQAQQWFAEPVALPDIADLNPLPPVVEPGEDAVTLAFGVTEYGRVQDLERLDDNEKDDTQAFRLMRQLRKTTFRPRIEAGEPVETQKLVKAFHLQ